MKIRYSMLAWICGGISFTSIFDLATLIVIGLSDIICKSLSTFF